MSVSPPSLPTNPPQLTANFSQQIRSATTLRSILLRHEYCCEQVYALLGIPHPGLIVGDGQESGVENGDFRSPWRQKWNRAVNERAQQPIANDLDLLVRLFEMRQALPFHVVAKSFGDSELSLLLESGLLERLSDDVRACFQLQVIDGTFVLSDFDVVAFPEDRASMSGQYNTYAMPIYLETHVFAKVVPRQQVDVALDMCTGCGVHALLLGAHANRVVGTDISRRALSIARFNRKLNELPHVEFLVSDIWSALGTQRFDLVTCNPPYQPDVEMQPGENWWGAGSRGEAIWRPIVEKLHQHLNPKGRAFFVMQALDWRDDDFMSRVRGYAGEGMDVEFNSLGTIPKDEFAQRYPEQKFENLIQAKYGILKITNTHS